MIQKNNNNKLEELFLVSLFVKTKLVHAVLSKYVTRHDAAAIINASAKI